MTTRTSDNDKGRNLVIIAWVFNSIQALLVSFRLFSRITRLRKVMVDDHLIICATLGVMAHTIVIHISWRLGLGQHFDFLTQAQQQSVLKLIITSVEPLSIVSSFFGRLSFCAFLLKIINPTTGVKHKTLWSIVGIQIVANLVCIIQIYAQCGDKVEALWDPTIATSTQCQSPMVQTVIGYVQSSMNSFCDILLTILPMTILWELQMPKARKLSLALMLGLSAIAFGASIAKCVAIGNLGKGDLTWYMVALQRWCVVENATVNLAATIPTLGLTRRTPSAGDNSYEARIPRIRHADHSLTGPRPDGDSQEHILLSSKITKITKVSFAYRELGAHEPKAEGAVPAILKDSKPARHSEGQN